jgi:predicted ArsR family transcriptional regulator
VSQIATQIDAVITGTKEVHAKSHPIASKWDKFIGKTIGSSADKFSLGAIAKETIEEKLAEEQLTRVRLMINKRFGPDTWNTILEERELRIEKHKKQLKKETAKKQEANEKLYKILETIAGYVFLAVVIGGVGAYIWWAKK